MVPYFTKERIFSVAWFSNDELDEDVHKTFVGFKFKLFIYNYHKSHKIFRKFNTF